MTIQAFVDPDAVAHCRIRPDEGSVPADLAAAGKNKE